jgi:hypothetical protein
VKKVTEINEFEDIVINSKGTIKILMDDSYVEISKECACELGQFITKVWELVAPEADEADEEDFDEELEQAKK